MTPEVVLYPYYTHVQKWHRVHLNWKRCRLLFQNHIAVVETIGSLVIFQWKENMALEIMELYKDTYSLKFIILYIKNICMESLLITSKIIADSWIVYLDCFYLMVRYQGTHCLVYRKSMRCTSFNKVTSTPSRPHLLHKALSPNSGTPCVPMEALFIQATTFHSLAPIGL